MAMTWPCPSWSVLLRRIVTSLGRFLDVVGVQTDQLRAAEGAGKADE
jgi:hypothetical protein